MNWILKRKRHHDPIRAATIVEIVGISPQGLCKRFTAVIRQSDGAPSRHPKRFRPVAGA